jgi:hypothetical protein
MLGASVLVHAAVFGGPLAARRAGAAPERLAMARHADLAHRVAEVSLPLRIQGARRDLVARARADRAAGRPSLGELLLQAGALDAREQGRVIDLERARAPWAERLAQLRAAPP